MIKTILGIEAAVILGLGIIAVTWAFIFFLKCVLDKED